MKEVGKLVIVSDVKLSMAEIADPMTLLGNAMSILEKDVASARTLLTMLSGMLEKTEETDSMSDTREATCPTALGVAVRPDSMSEKRLETSAVGKALGIALEKELTSSNNEVSTLGTTVKPASMSDMTEEISARMLLGNA